MLPRLFASYLFLASAAAGLSETLLLRNGESVQHAEFKGHARWKLIPYLWSDKAVNVTCTFTKDFKVYTSSTLEGLSDKVARRENVWCGWHNFLGQHSCVARLSPFGAVNVAIAHDVPTSKLCRVELDEHVSFLMILQTLAGAFFFLNASQLSASMFFRLGTGSAGVMMLSVIILLFILSRTLPSKKSAAALFAIFGSSFTGMVRYVFGQWIPSFEQLIYNKIFLAYMALSGLIGLACTYYYDREDNVKLHNILKYGLKLVGLVLMAFSTSMPEASVTLCCLLLAAQLAHPAMFLWHRGEVSSKTLGDLVLDSPGGFRRRMAHGRLAASRFKPQAVANGKTTDFADTEPETGEDALDGETSDEGPWAANLNGERTPGPPSEYRQDPSSPDAVAMPLGMGASDSPWLKRGLALNLETGRTVKMGGSTWNKLVLQGYQLDRTQGTLTPPHVSRQNDSPASDRPPSSRARSRRTPT